MNNSETSIADRLRAMADQYHEGSEYEVLLRVAADEIDALDKENQRLWTRIQRTINYLSQ